MNNLSALLKKFFLSLLINLGTIAITAPILAVCFLLTFTLAFGAGSLVGSDLSNRLFRRIVQGLSLTGCLGSLMVNGVLIFYVYRRLEERFKKDR